MLQNGLRRIDLIGCNMYKIDLHTHSKFSDGSNSILEMALRSRKLGFPAYVITDHDSVGAYYESRVEAKWVSQILQYPIIVGCEISTYFGHCLLFGKRAIESWYKDIKYYQGISDAEIWCREFEARVTRRWSGDIIRGEWVAKKYKDNPYALILNHPNSGNVGKEFTKLLSGFEIENSGDNWEEKYPKVVSGLREGFKEIGRTPVELKNSDAHGLDTLGISFNETIYRITNEQKLIAWLNRYKKDE